MWHVITRDRPQKDGTVWQTDGRTYTRVGQNSWSFAEVGWTSLPLGDQATNFLRKSDKPLECRYSYCEYCQRIRVRIREWKNKEDGLIIVCWAARPRSTVGVAGPVSYLRCIMLDAASVIIANESMPEIIINDTIFCFFNCNPYFGNFKPQKFPNAVW